MLPRPVATTGDVGVQLRVVDLFTWEGQSEAASAAGEMWAEADPVESGYYWRVERVVTSVEGSTAIPLVWLYAASPGDTDPRPTALRDYSRYGLYAIGEYPATLLIPAGAAAIVRWTGADSGAIGYASVQYQLVQRIGG